MSYSDDRDEIAEMFGVQPKVKKSGYSEELPKAEEPEIPPKKDTNLPPELPPEPEVKAEFEVAVPVKLRPPPHFAPPPLEDLPADPTPSPAPPVPEVESEVESEVADEDFLVYDEAETPDFLETALVSFEDIIAEPPPQKTSVESRFNQKKAPVTAPVEDEKQTDLEPPQKEAPPAPPFEEKPPAKPELSAAVVAPAPVIITQESRPTSRSERDPSERTFSEERLLDTEGLVKIYDGRTVVNGIAINVRPGEIVGLLGPNGAGKTTSFYMIVGLVPPNGGKVMFNGNDVTKMPMYKRARLGMGYLPQEESIFRKLTVEQNIMAVMETLSIPRKEKVERCNELLERFGITHIRKNIALTCSGGEKRRVTIARSLVTEPSLVMLDEPFSGVDPIAVNEIQNIVADLRDSGLAILITDHNARQTLELVDRAYLIYEGRVLREGTRDFLINDPVSRELYLGDRFTM